MHIFFHQLKNLACDGSSASLRQKLAGRSRTMLRSVVILAILLTLPAVAVFAKQGAVRALYTVPNTTFIEQPTGESVVTINDTSGSISSLQAAIDNARSANPGNVIVIHLLRGAIYSVSSAGLVLGSHECLVAEGASVRPSRKD